jgi:hypothetical protein
MRKCKYVKNNFNKYERKGFILLMGKKHLLSVGIMLFIILIAIAKVDVKAANVIKEGDEGNITWTLYDDGLLDIKGTGELGTIDCDQYEYHITSITINEGITSIGSSAFGDYYELKSISIPNSVTSIGRDAFLGCYSLTDLTIPDSVVSIGESAFYQCESLTSLTIPASVTDIGERAFSFCDSLTEIIIPESVTSIGAYILDDCKKLKKIVNNSSALIEFDPLITDYAWYNINDGKNPIFSMRKGTVIKGQLPVLHYNIIFDGNGATSGTMKSLIGKSEQDISIPKNRFKRPGYRFISWKYKVDNESYYCDENSSIYFSYYEVKKYNIKSIKLLAQWELDPYYGLKKAGTTIKDATSKAKYIVVSNEVDNPTVKYVKNTSKNAKAIIIPSTIKVGNVTYKVTEINAKALKGNKKVTKVVLGKNIIKIGDEAFSGCSALNSVSLNSDLTTIGNKAFFDCKSLRAITLHEETNKLGKQFVGNCQKLKKIRVKSENMTKKSLADGAFDGINRAIIKVPEDYTASYKKLFTIKGLSNTNEVLDPWIDPNPSTSEKDGGNYCVALAIPLIKDIPQNIVFAKEYSFDRWYKIKLTKKQAITIKQKKSSGSYYYYGDEYFRIYDANLSSVSCNKISSNTFRTTLLSKGTYYIKCPAPEDPYLYSDPSFQISWK